MIQELYTLRHGQTDYNKQGIVQGRGVNSSINERGQQQAAAFHAHYRHLDFDAIYVSELVRTHQTVAPFVEQDGYALIATPNLDEIGWGIHEGKRPTPENRQEYKDVVTAWTGGDLTATIPGGESPLVVADRLKLFLAELHQTDHKRVLLCTHGRTSRVLFCLLMGLPLQQMQQFNHHNTGFSKFVPGDNGLYRAEFLNNIDHLEASV